MEKAKKIFQVVFNVLWPIMGALLGSLIMTLGLNMFLIPNIIASGGVSGLGIIIFHTLNIPVGLTILISNIPLFIAAWKFLGTKFVIRSLAGSLFLPLLVEGLSFLPVITTDLLLASIYGGILLGIGLGIVFRSGSSTGGTALAAQLLHYSIGLSTGQSLLGIDFIIIAFAGLVFSAELAMYALISLIVTSKVIDLVQEGLSIAKACYIISDSGPEIGQAIKSDLDRGYTVLKGQGGFTGQEKEILLCVVSQAEVTSLKKIVWHIDPESFVIVSNVHEVLGEGFQRH
ncbi:MAG: YitT family protein [Candidatus Contubernalis sp.]|nr:YitT family protein [Candidatus Contubernalis sp.]